MKRSRFSFFNQSFSPRLVNFLLTVLVLSALFGLSLAKNVAQEAAEKQPVPAAEAKATEAPAAAPETKPEAKTKPAEAPKPVAESEKKSEAEAKPAAEEKKPEAEVKPAEAEKKDNVEAKGPTFPLVPGAENATESFAADATASTTVSAAKAAPLPEAKPVPFYEKSAFTWMVFLIILIGSFYAGQTLSKAWRLPDHSFRIFLLLFVFFGSVAASILGWHRLTLGIDLRGGVVLVYDAVPIKDRVSTDPNAPGSASGGIDMDQLTRAIAKRINPAGVREIAISKLGSRQIQVIIPEAEDAEVARIRRIISESGALEFRILASTNYAKDQPIIDRAQREKDGRVIRDSTGNRIAEWVPVDEKEGRSILGTPDVIKRERNGRNEVLVLYNDGCDVTGQYLSWVGKGNDENGRPGVSFHFNAIGESTFRLLTSANKPDPAQPDRLKRQLGILMNDSLYSAPYINAVIGASGIISFGQRHTQAEINQLNQDITDLIAVLDAGSLPAELSKEPVSQLLIGATLGDDTIKKANIALVSSLVLVLGFMLVYYRLAGLIACFCVLTNLAMIIAVMLAVRAAFTLPGLAGLVLTLGMAVDANILIYERLREELAAGASLKMAIRNAYAKALSAIVDSNLTTILTGIILYAVGTEQVKGFAVTLVLGVTFSMFTAIYCARTIMDCMEAQRTISTFSMLQFFKRPNINFIGARNACATFSIIITVIGILAVVARGRGILDIDFIGGVSVEAVFKDSQKVEDIRAKLSNLNDLSVQTVRLNLIDAERDPKAKSRENTRFIITTSIPQNKEKEVLPEDYLREVRDELKSAFKDSLVYREFNSSFEESADKSKTVVRLTVNPGMNHESLQSAIGAEMRSAVASGALPNDFTFVLSNKEFFEGSLQIYDNWTLTTDASREVVEKILLPMTATINDTPLFPTSTTVGGSVAKDTRTAGLIAILGSLVCIVLYIWLRFHKLVFGIAAAIGLIHVVLVALGLIAISKWFVTPLGFLQVEEFKIGLAVVAAFLTIIGYSLNDTIILFDRIRENRGKNPKLTDKMINDATNQTLSRTVLTAGSTAMVSLILYFWGGQGIHTFAFAMSVGVIFGTYSTIGIAAPLLLWMSGEVEQRKDERDAF